MRASGCGGRTYTDYEADLESRPADELWADDEAAYYDARRAAHAAVDAFLAAHRDSTSGRS